MKGVLVSRRNNQKGITVQLPVWFVSSVIVIIFSSLSRYKGSIEGPTNGDMEGGVGLFFRRVYLLNHLGYEYEFFPNIIPFNKIRNT